jgi:hypothetical protein
VTRIPNDRELSGLGRDKLLELLRAYRDERVPKEARIRRHHNRREWEDRHD